MDYREAIKAIEMLSFKASVTCHNGEEQERVCDAYEGVVGYLRDAEDRQTKAAEPKPEPCPFCGGELGVFDDEDGWKIDCGGDLNCPVGNEYGEKAQAMEAAKMRFKDD